MTGTTHTGAKLHRLAGQLEHLPTSGMIALAKASKRLIEAEARAAGVGTMRLSGRARGPRQEGPARARRTVRLKARDTLSTGNGGASLRLQAVPVGPWVWANTGTGAHLVGQLRGKGRRPAWIRGAGYGHGVRGPVIHPGAAGHGAWRHAAAKVVQVAPVAFTDELAELVRAF